jgi:hypothetical protein
VKLGDKVKIGDKIYTVSSYMNGDTKTYDIPKVCTTYEKAKKEIIRQAKCWCKDNNAEYINKFTESNDYCYMSQNNEDGGYSQQGISCEWEIYITTIQ